MREEEIGTHRVVVQGTGSVGKASLRAGKNVVDTSMGIFQYPPRVPAPMKQRIASACAANPE